ncbi:MAG: LuxR C-terminal-related transcriptional regulator [Deltaproteobacteria bacterium]
MRLDDEALARLREALAAVKQTQGRRVPREVLASLSEALPSGVGMTIDFDAAEALGQPVVILRPAEAMAPCFATLTPREREVAGLVATGLRNRDIAMALAISVATVKDHVHRILTKSGLDSRAAIAAVWTG